MGLQAFDETLAVLAQENLVNANGTAYSALVPSGTGQKRLDAIVTTNTDAIAHVVNLQVTVGATSTFLGSVSVPAGAGVGGVAPVDLIAGLGLASLTALVLPAASILSVAVAVAVTAPQTVAMTAFGGTV